MWREGSAEIALTLEVNNLEELLTQHIPGKPHYRVWAPGGPQRIPDEFSISEGALWSRRRTFLRGLEIFLSPTSTQQRTEANKLLRAAYLVSKSLPSSSLRPFRPVPQGSRDRKGGQQAV